MLELLKEPAPRAEPTVKRLTADAAKRTKRMAAILGLVFLILGSVVAGIMVILQLSDPGPWGDMAVMIPAMFFFVGILPAFAIRRILMRDVRALVRVAREGRVFQPIAAGDRLDLYGGMSSLSLVWKEDGKEVLAQLDVFKPDLQPVLASDVRVLARPRDKYVLAVLGDNGVFVGLRRRYFGKIVKD